MGPDQAADFGEEWAAEFDTGQGESMGDFIQDNMGDIQEANPEVPPL
jgi:hypothetical protein